MHAYEPTYPCSLLGVRLAPNDIYGVLITPCPIRVYQGEMCEHWHYITDKDHSKFHKIYTISIYYV